MPSNFKPSGLLLDTAFSSLQFVELPDPFFTFENSAGAYFAGICPLRRFLGGLDGTPMPMSDCQTQLSRGVNINSWDVDINS